MTGVVTTHRATVFAIGGLSLLITTLLATRLQSRRFLAADNPSEPAPPPVSHGAAEDRALHAAQGMIERFPSDAKGYNALAIAYMHKARETGDFGFNAKAEAALKRSRQLDSSNFDASKLEAMLLLTYHRFAKAREIAQRAQQLRPQDHEVYGSLTDALVELGDYDGASQAAQTMINLRPDTAAYARASYLRALHGDTAGAIAAMRLAVQAANPQDAEGVAWCRVHLGYELMNAGRFDEAEREFDLALAVFPNYHLALVAKARARLAAGDAAGALELYTRAQSRVPAPDTVGALGDLFQLLGRTADAQRQYDLLEFIEHAGMPGAETYSLQMALFWANHDTRLDDALAIAQRERAVRVDIYTCDTLAWCLYKKDELTEAKRAIDDALRLGTHDARIYYHAGMIQKGLGDQAAAMKYLRLALDTNASFDVLQAPRARGALAELGG